MVKISAPEDKITIFGLLLDVPISVNLQLIGAFFFENKNVVYICTGALCLKQ